MKHLLRSFTTLVFVAIAHCAVAQTWDQTGNAITVGSKLGSTNGLPLKFITNNIERMRLDTFGRLSLNYGSPIATLAIVKKGSSLPGTIWAPTGTPMFTAFGESVGGNADFIVGMAGDAFNFRPTIMGRRSRGTLNAPTVVQNNDQLTSFTTSGFDGTNFQIPAAVEFYVDGTPSAGSVPARISFVTGSNGATRAERLKITNTGNFAFNVDQMYLKSTTGALGMGTTAPNASSILDINSTTKGVLIPRMTMAQRDAIASPATGLLIYQTDNDSGFHYYSSTSWKAITAPPGDYANTSLSNLVAPTAVNADLLPDANGLRDLGSASLAWKDFYFTGDAILGGNRFLSTRGSNSFFGVLAGNPAVTGSYNTGVGTSALASNVSGNWNTANGYTALTNANNAYSNTATGFQAALANTTGSYNTATGVLALGSNTTGVSNSATGVAALTNLTSGSYNIGMGYFSGANLPTGNYNTYVGSYADGPSGVSITNATAIGYNAQVTGSNAVRVGNTSVTSIGGQVGWTTFPSDRRFKKNVKEDVPGLAFINKLRPVTYNVDVESIDKVLRPATATEPAPATGTKRQTTAEEIKAQQEKAAIKYTGFIAQEVEVAAKELNYNFSGVDVPKTSKDLYGLRYAEFVVPLVKAVQELSTANQAKDAKIDAQQKINSDLQKQIDELKEALMKVIAEKSPCTTSK